MALLRLGQAEAEHPDERSLAEECALLIVNKRLRRSPPVLAWAPGLWGGASHIQGRSSSQGIALFSAFQSDEVSRQVDHASGRCPGLLRQEDCILTFSTRVMPAPFVFPVYMWSVRFLNSSLYSLIPPASHTSCMLSIILPWTGDTKT